MHRRLSDLAAALSLASDLGHGAALEHQLRVAVLAVRVADEMGLDAAQCRDSYDVALLRWLGCTATAQPLSAWMGDEIAAHNEPRGSAARSIRSGRSCATPGPA